MEGILEVVVQMAFADLQQEQLTDEVEAPPSLTYSTFIQFTHVHSHEYE